MRHKHPSRGKGPVSANGDGLPGKDYTGVGEGNTEKHPQSVHGARGDLIFPLHGQGSLGVSLGC